MFNQQDMVDLGLSLEVYADGVGCLDNLGQTFQTTYFRWMRTSRVQAGRVYVRVPVLRLIRPRTSILKKDGMFATWLAQLPAPPIGQPAPFDPIHG